MFLSVCLLVFPLFSTPLNVFRSIVAGAHPHGRLACQINRIRSKTRRTQHKNLPARMTAVCRLQVRCELRHCRLCGAAYG